MAEERDGSGLCVDVALRQVDVVVVGFAEDGDLCLEPIVLQGQLFSVLSCFLWHKKEDNLRDLSYLQDALALADAEIVWHCNLPLGGLLADVADDDGLLGLILDGNEAKVKLVGEVKHCATTTSADGHNELFALSHDHQVIRVVGLRLGRELDDVGDVHPWGDLGRHLVDLRGRA